MTVFSKVLVLSLVLAAMGLLVPDQANANAEAEAVKEISNHFTTVPTMTGEFIQFGPNGEQTGGKFYIHRPGRIRFNYEDPSPIMVVSNGKTLAVNNKKLKTWSYYPLDKTPLSLLLSNEIKIEDKSVRSVETNEDVTRVVMGDKNIFGDSEITLLFDPQNYDLRQWTIKDAQGKETSVMIFNVEKNISLNQKLFRIIKKDPLDRGSNR